MATLSRLKEQDTERHRTPEWITRLQEDAGFVAHDLGAASQSRAVSTPARADPLDQAYQDGLAAGRAEKEAEDAVEASTREQFQLALKGFNAEASAALSAALTETVVSLCSQIIEPALIDRDALAERCETAIHQLGEAQAHLKLHLHPEDRLLIADALQPGPRLVEDATLSRGAFRLEGKGGVIADSPEDWRRVLRGALCP